MLSCYSFHLPRQVHLWQTNAFFPQPLDRKRAGTISTSCWPAPWVCQRPAILPLGEKASIPTIPTLEILPLERQDYEEARQRFHTHLLRTR